MEANMKDMNKKLFSEPKEMWDSKSLNCYKCSTALPAFKKGHYLGWDVTKKFVVEYCEACWIEVNGIGTFNRKIALIPNIGFGAVWEI